MTLALIAGEGRLPTALMAALDASSTSFLLCELAGHPAEARDGRPILRFRIEKLGSFLKDLRSSGVDRVCFAGRIGRPKLDPSQIDAETMPLVPRMMVALQAGDDTALRVVLKFFEEVGIVIVAAQDILPALMPGESVQGTKAPSEADERDAERGAEIIAAMGAVDLGQACIVANGQALAVETIGGTDWMMRSLLRTPEGALTQAPPSSWDDPLGYAADWLTGPVQDQPSRLERDPELPEGGLLIKGAKPDQDMRVDVPTIGPQTFLRAAEVGLRGVVVKAREVLILDQATCVEIADRQNLLFWVRS
ncbi:LpxI family protein [Litoreibacter roseus]|uniref:Phosphatidate cytidylyltransferase n=1 Tax=Litoreibacter roseus TaxID=2601869 RepID=A0A6N6JMX6_9RHOB|nr:UDP-2,3-diacylglucosamine diphosphatase LpxI [Litoreibacter roseus]GFE66829.1 hypothetical protein KIN_39030 [Litoreibacter roseus]